MADQPEENQLPATDQQPAELPSHVKKAIDAHRGGTGMKLMWVHPQLASDLAKVYGEGGLAAIHDPKLHGELDAVTGDRMAINPDTAMTLPPKPQATAEPEPGPQVMINDQPGVENLGVTDPVIVEPGKPDTNVEINDLPGQEAEKPERNPDLMAGNSGSSMVGPGVRFDGKQYLYWTGTSWKPANVGPLQSKENTPPGLA